MVKQFFNFMLLGGITESDSSVTDVTVAWLVACVSVCPSVTLVHPAKGSE